MFREMTAARILGALTQRSSQLFTRKSSAAFSNAQRIWLLLIPPAAVLGWLVSGTPHISNSFILASPLKMVLAFGGLLLAMVIIWRPVVGLVVLIALVWLNLSQILERFHGIPSLLHLLALPLLVAAVRTRLQEGFGGLHIPLLLWAAALFAMVPLISSTYALDPQLSDQRAAEALKALIILLMIFFLVDSEIRLRAATWSLVIAGTFLAALGFAQLVMGDLGNDLAGLARVKYAHVYGDDFKPRLAGPVGDPGFFGQILVLLVPLAFHIGWYEKGRVIRALGWLSLIGLIIAVGLTYSRGAMLALLVTLMLLLFTHRLFRPKYLAILFIALPVVFAVASSDFGKRLSTAALALPGGQDELHPDSSIELRLLFSKTALAMFANRPLTGVGAGNYASEYLAYADEIGSDARHYGDADEGYYAHSLYLELAAETGLIGLTAYVLVMSAALISIFHSARAFRSAGDVYLAGLSRCLSISLISYLITSLFLHGHFQRYLWVIFGLIAAISVLPRTQPLHISGKSNETP